ncbi:DUF2726 domain-containing protein [Roseateles amylovorans]|uniref:DUF2726 domain-containing protein n=1 Tax=Roseateles amylovorans TaxID=2978473 RepID=A0ABY6B1M4_9BURK|nr:DUF2726 domain-containing protein [Roseateles amylovorans]UXH79302.1 DUF2726 domain-containing protein [Roseateles amylovorans]
MPGTMQHYLPWIIAGLSGLVVVAMAMVLVSRRQHRRRKPLPTQWSLAARPVFSTDERRVFRLLREALPHHLVMCKLPIVRFCQPTEAKDVRYWYDLLGGISVNFAICSPNGRVLAAIDLDTGRPGSARSLEIKQSVLTACRIRYLRTTAEQLPSASELQLLVPYSNQGARSPQPAKRAPAARAPVAAPMASAPSAARRPPVRNTLWNESPVFSDSFFAPDSRFDAFNGPTDTPPSPVTPAEPRARGYRPRASGSLGDSLSGRGADSQFPDEAADDIVGVVVDSPRFRQH